MPTRLLDLGGGALEGAAHLVHNLVRRRGAA
jgi:hypothetical protein